jgi:hypothetical protein
VSISTETEGLSKKPQLRPMAIVIGQQSATPSSLPLPCPKGFFSRGASEHQHRCSD